MPLLDAYPLPDADAHLGIWKMTEPLTFFESRLTLFPREVDEIKTLKERKKGEWFCSRYVLHVLSDRHIRGACLKDEFGKPFLEGSSYHISMSHSEYRTAIIASPHKVGIDIQHKVEKITRIAPKFLSEKELSQIPKNNEINYLHFYWGAKEALYKIYGKKEVDFKKHLTILPFSESNGIFMSSGLILKDANPIRCYIKARVYDDFILVYAWEAPESEF